MSIEESEDTYVYRKGPIHPITGSITKRWTFGSMHISQASVPITYQDLHTSTNGKETGDVLVHFKYYYARPRHDYFRVPSACRNASYRRRDETGKPVADQVTTRRDSLELELQETYHNQHV